MGLPLWVEVLIAMFAVFGVYSAVRMIASAVFAASNLGVTVRVRTKEDAESLEALLREAEDTFLFGGHAPTTVLFFRGAVDGVLGNGDTLNEPTIALLTRYGAEYLMIDE